MRSEKQKAAILAAIKKHATTKSYAELAKLLGLSRGVLTYVSHQAGFHKPFVGAKNRANQARMRKFILAHARTHTMAHMGRVLGVTRQRVLQLCQKWQIKRPRTTYSKLQTVSDRELRKVVRQPKKPFYAMASELGVTNQTLVDELRRRGIKPITQGGRTAKRSMRGSARSSASARARSRRR